MAKGFGPFGKIQEALKKAQQVREGAQQLQTELDSMEIVGEAGEGKVKVTLSGNQEPRSVSLTPEALQETPEALSEMLLTAMNDAYIRSTETMRERMEDLTGGIDLPGFGA
ncbi:MAG: YbaB/EbfC family nucleoid-associated protein [Cyanobacteria bacterium J06642_2]